jgi:hypothetical protein
VSAAVPYGAVKYVRPIVSLLSKPQFFFKGKEMGLEKYTRIHTPGLLCLLRVVVQSDDAMR